MSGNRGDLVSDSPSVLFVMQFGSNVSYYWDTAEVLYRRIGDVLHSQNIRSLIAYPRLDSNPPRNLVGSSLQIVELDCQRTTPRAQYDVAQLIKRERVEIVFYATSNTYIKPNFLFNRLAGARHVWVYTHASYAASKSLSLRYLVKSSIYRGLPWVCPELVLVPSQFVWDRTVFAGGFPGKKTALVYNGIDCDRFKPDRNGERPGDSSPRFRVICVCRATRNKGVQHFIEAARILARKRRDIEFLYVGDGPQLAEFKSLASQDGLQDLVTFTGRRTDVDALLRTSHIAVVPTIQAEAFCLTVTEAMASGVPTIASRIGAIPELIDDATGVLVEPGQPSQIADAVERLLGDPARARAMAESARARVMSLFSLEAQVEAITNRMLEVLRGT
jgi:glycosyltransferase involved in cell wall biosynthesis